MSSLLRHTSYIDQARAATGLEDFGPDGWREGFERLVAALTKQPLHEQGVQRVESRLVGTLSARLRVEDWIARNPAYGEGEIEGPLVIIGLPRTATTALQNLLANEKGWRFVRSWEAGEPVPPPDIATEADDPRVAAERAWLAVDKTYEGKHIHQAGGPVDDAAILRLSFRNQELGWPAWNYTRWWRDCNMAETYTYHKRVLRLLQKRRPPHRWLIKAPWHNFHLEQLVETYPHARFVMTHRDPAKLIPSVSSLIETAYGTVLPKAAIDPFAIGRNILEHLQISLERVTAYRAKHGSDRFLDIYHQDFLANPMGEVGRLYDWLGLSISNEAATLLAGWATENRKGAKREHSYTAAYYGVSDADLDERFEGYRTTVGA